MSMFSENTTFNQSNGTIVHLNINYIYRMLQMATIKEADVVSLVDRKKLRSYIDSVDIERSFNAEDVEERDTFKTLKEIVHYTTDVPTFDDGMLKQHLYDEPSINGTIDNRILYNVVEATSNTILHPNLVDRDSMFNLKQDISGRLNYSTVVSHLDNIEEFIASVRNAEMSFSGVAKHGEEIISKLYNEIMHNKTNTEEDMNTLMLGGNLTDEELALSEENQRNMLMKMDTVHPRLRTGYQVFNYMTGGGFEGSRVYGILAASKHFKSGTMLNLIMGMIKYNDDIEMGDSDLRPMIVYLTQENTAAETYERIYTILTGRNFNAEPNKIKAKKVVDNFFKEHRITLDIDYRASQSITTDYLEEMTERHRADGFKVVAVVQDYIRRIRSSLMPAGTEARVVYGSIVDEFRNYAVKHDVPVITASQLNREGVRLIEEDEHRDRHDTATKLGATHIAESMQIIENLDYSIIVNLESAISDSDFLSAEGNENLVNPKYLSVKFVAGRSVNLTKRQEYSVIRFDNSMHLVEDQNTAPLYGHSIANMRNDDLPADVLNALDVFSRNKRSGSRSQANISDSPFATENKIPGENVTIFGGNNNSYQPVHPQNIQPMFNATETITQTSQPLDNSVNDQPMRGISEDISYTSSEDNLFEESSVQRRTATINPQEIIDSAIPQEEDFSDEI